MFPSLLPARPNRILLVIGLALPDNILPGQGTEGIEDPPDSTIWRPAPPPPTTEFDWIGLTSGEWLKGEIKSIYDEEIEFDSEELDLLTLDMEDVAIIRTAGRFTLNVGNRQPVSGRIVADDKLIRVHDGDSSTTISRSKLVAAVAERAGKADPWSAKIAFGANFRSGNTDEVEYNSKINVQRRSAWSRFQLDYLGSLSRNNDVKTADNTRLTSTFDIFITPHWFVRPVGGEYFRDTFQNIRHRVTGYGGVGYEIVDTPRFDWNVFAGPGFLYTEFEDPTEDDEADAFAGIFSSRFEYELNRFQDLNGTYQATATNKDSGGYIHNLLLSLENEIVDDFDIDITFVWSRISHPAETSDGETPDPDDFQLLFSLGYEL